MAADDARRTGTAEVERPGRDGFAGRPLVKPLAEHTLPANQEGMSLKQLAELYPAPKENQK